MTDNVGNTYAQIPNAMSVYSTTMMKDLWYVKNTRAGATAITITPNPNGNNGAAVIWEFAGVDTVSPIDRVAVLNTQPASSSPVGASVTTSVPGALVISLLGTVGGITGLAAGSLFTSDAVFYGTGWAHRVTSSTGSYAAQWTTAGGGFHSSTVSFKPAATSGACDVNGDGAVNIADVQRIVNMANGTETCTVNITGVGVCNTTTVQRVVNAALGQPCVVDPGDTTAPSVSVTAPTAGSTVSGTITVRASATDNVGTSGVQFYLDGAPLGAEVTGSGPLYSMNWNTATASNGTHTLSARVRDTSGNLTTSAAVSFTVSNTAAVPKTVTLSWVASVTPGVTYNIYRGTTSGGPYSTKVNSSPIVGTSFTDTSVVSGQTYYYVARSVDASGTESVNSNQATAVVP
jgi:hypothetical protein